MYNHPNIDECAVIGVTHKLLGEEVCAFVKIKNESKTDEKEIKEFCRNKIADYKQPKIIIIINNLKNLNEIPKGSTKKILYRKLRQYYKDNY